MSKQVGTWQQEIREIRKSALKTMFWVVALVSGFAPAVCMWWDYDGGLPLAQQLNTFWSLAVRTYPLTISIAVIAMSRQLGWFKYGRIFFMGAVITAGASLGQLTSGWVGQGGQAVEAANMISTPDNQLFAPLVNSFNYLVGYYQLYGARDFLAAILVGSFVGRTASKILRRSSELEEVVRKSIAEELPRALEGRKAA